MGVMSGLLVYLYAFITGKKYLRDGDIALEQ